MEKKYKIKVPDTVHRMTEIYHTLGLWKTGNGNVSFPQAVYFTLFFAFAISSFVGVCTCDDWDNATFPIVVILVVMVQVYRLYFIICKQNQILNLMHTVGADSTDDYHTFCNANRKMKKLMTIARTFVGISYTLCIAAIVLPVVKKQLIFDIAFPLDYKTNEVAFWMSYTFVVGAYILSVTILMFVTMMWYMMLVFVIKYDFVASEFRNLGVQRKVSRSENQVKKIEKAQGNVANCEKEETSCIKDFVESIKNLNVINGQIDEFESIFSSLFLLQIVTSSICICGTTFVLAFSTRDNFFQAAFYLVETFYCIADIFAVMYLANEIFLSSDSLSYSLFESNWIYQTQSCKKYILIVVEYLKQPRLLVVGSLIPMNLETFIAIVNRAYSMFNILRNFQQ